MSQKKKRMRRKDLTTQERTSILQTLLLECKNGKPPRGKMKAMEEKFHVCRKTISRIWAEAKHQQQQGQCISSQSKKICRPRRRRVHIDLELIASIELTKRSTIRRLAKGINCSKSTVGRWVDQGLIKAHTNAIKPDLTAANKLLRMRFCLEAMEYDRQQDVLRFKTMHNTIHIDEKWFYITKSSQRWYLTPAEAEPHRACKNKKFIQKVMFSCAVCRPLFAQDGSVLFDGKIGIFPYTEMVAAKRSSKNRVAGTLEQKSIESITKDVVREGFIKQLVPAIKAKWPSFYSKDIFIQQDNARPHIRNDDLEFREVASSDGFNINIIHQPPNSPDTNINDLGWFRAIQSLQQETACFNVDDLVKAVVSSFEELDPMTLNCVFLSLQGCMLETLKVKGQNCYKLPHMKKGSLIRQDRLPLCLDVPQQLVSESIAHLEEKGEVEGIEELKQRLGIHEATLDGIESQFNALMLLD
ncbi:uncharacterized protein LOC131014581 [Salvia miltiorrhiza]|uniref:uncharacterized protein LOC131014581 n=1 Tax=Salvia miltiorrhiza TaxID=226208 RepID=UPI0025AB74C3|nr:uncharacterized protein LOC131014581 [Salvia miltiorrhiza]